MAAPTEPPFEFTTEQDQSLAAIALAMKLLAVVLLGLAAVRIAFGVIEIFTSSWAGLWYIVEGLATGFMGLVLLAGATDTQFIVDTTGYDKPHLLNAFTSLAVFYKVQIGLALFIGVIVLLRILF
ncbi:MAG: hypothetical protein HY040_19250 [Planctomycetes bacterium]|nr:hypothetical protein [Planctomycetota bacterium]